MALARAARIHPYPSGDSLKHRKYQAGAPNVRFCTPDCPVQKWYLCSIQGINSTGCRCWKPPMLRTRLPRRYSIAVANNNYSVSQKITPRFFDIFSKTVGKFSPNVTCLLYVPIYARLRNFIQFSPTVTKLCHIKCDHPACVSADGAQFKHNDVNWVVALNMT